MESTTTLKDHLMGILNDSGLNMFEDLIPYGGAVAAWFMGLDWGFIIMMTLAAARLWVAWQELKLKKEGDK